MGLGWELGSRIGSSMNQLVIQPLTTLEFFRVSGFSEPQGLTRVVHVLSVSLGGSEPPDSAVHVEDSLGLSTRSVRI